MLLVNEFLERSAASTPDKVALVCNDQRLTYAEVDAMANRLANGLRASGIMRGDRVVLFLPNSVELVVGIFAILKAGAVFVIVNHTTKLDKLRFLLANSEARALITLHSQISNVTELINQIPSLKFAILTGARGDEPARENQPYQSLDFIQSKYPDCRPTNECIDQDLACLIYTSGSTGEPKGVMSTHDNIVFAASSIITYLENRADDIVINALPLSFDYGLYQLLMVFKFGGTLVLERSFAYPASTLRRMQQERVTGLPGVPTLFALLLKLDLSKYDLSHLRYITNTAAALPVNHIRQIREMFPHATLYSMYGLTETKRTLYLPPKQLDVRPGSVGVAIPGTEVWLEDESGAQLGPNQIGELVIRGRHVMRGYWKNPEATAHRYRPGRIPGERVCYSGDLFRMDEDGFFYFVGRKDDIIKCKGEKVAPKEIENVLYGLPGVLEAAVVGVSDPILGEAIKAFIVSHDGLCEKDILRHCRNHLEDFMMPKQVEFREVLPKTESGKIKKTGLR